MTTLLLLSAQARKQKTTTTFNIVGTVAGSDDLICADCCATPAVRGGLKRATVRDGDGVCVLWFCVDEAGCVTRAWRRHGGAIRTHLARRTWQYRQARARKSAENSEVRQ